MKSALKQKSKPPSSEENVKLLDFTEPETIVANKKKEAATKGQSDHGTAKQANIKKNDKKLEKETFVDDDEEIDNDSAQKPQTKAGDEIQQRLWEKEQLQEINLRVGNILNVFSSKAEKSGKSTLDVSVLDELQQQHAKALKDLAEKFLEQEQKKTIELVDAKNGQKEAEDKYLQLSQELDEAKEKVEHLSAGIKALRDEKNRVARERDQLAAEKQNLKDALEAQLRTIEAANERLANENAKLKSGLDDSTEELQKKYVAQLAEALQDREDHHNQLKQKMEEMYKNKIDNLEKNLGKQIDDLKNSLEDQKKDIDDLEKTLFKTSQERDQALKDLEREKPIRENLKNEVEKQKNEVKNLKNKLDESEKDKQRISEEKTTVEKGNLDLRNEIEKLKDKLDMFEEKHHIRSPIPPKKRRRTDSTLMEPKTLKSVKGPLIESNLIFPLECITRQYEGDWIGFELQNQWNKPIVLKGWWLSTPDQTSRLALPEKRLNPKDTIRVCLTESKKEHGDIVWKGLQLKKGDQHELWVEDDLGFRHKIAVIPVPSNTPGFTPESCFVM